MAMSKKDYERAASITQDVVRASNAPESVRLYVEQAFVRLFSSEPRFDEHRFRRACVPGANVKARG